MANVVIHMGFVNTPYTKAAMSAPMSTAKTHEKKSRRHYSKTRTAENVANILEDKYGVLDIFMTMYGEEITGAINEKVQDFVVQSLSSKGKLSSDRMAQFVKPSTSQIEKMFRGFLDRNETGINTMASMLRGKPSFINTGVYRASFRVWADIK
jgi:hypothetical protein